MVGSLKHFKDEKKSETSLVTLNDHIKNESLKKLLTIAENLPKESQFAA